MTFPTTSLRLLAVFAHPDDEIGLGGTLARYAHTGADVTLVCATRGEAATIYCEDCATPDTLATVRTGNLSAHASIWASGACNGSIGLMAESAMCLQRRQCRNWRP